MTINFPTNVSQVVDDIRDGAGRNVTFYSIDSQTACTASGCGLDPITNTSVNSFCATCSGVYWIDIVTSNVIKARVSWGKTDILGWESGGQFMDGDVRLQIKYNAANQTIIDNTKEVLIDGRITEIKNIIPRGYPTLNRILINLIEREREDV